MTKIIQPTENKIKKFDIASCEKKYFKKCQIYTPDVVVQKLWEMLHKDKEYFEKVLDLGAGDGRFSKYGNYGKYLCIEIDKKLLQLNCLKMLLSENNVLFLYKKIIMICVLVILHM